MKETIIKNLEDTFEHLESEIRIGSAPNKNNLDGWTMQGLSLIHI